MKVLNLQCSQQHAFEGWFASEDDFQKQKANQWVQCPLCGDASVQKMPSAPRLNLKAGKKPLVHAQKAARQSGADGLTSHTSGSTDSGASADAGAAATQGSSSSQLATLQANHETDEAGSQDNLVSQQRQAAMLQALRQLVEKSVDVGERFADEARQMHYGEKQVRSIRGHASRTEALALLEEGIGIMPLPSVPGLTETLQ